MPILRKNRSPISLLFCLILNFSTLAFATDNYIYCSDMSGDIDDLGAMAELLHEHSTGKINLIASVLSVREGQGYRVMRHMANWYRNYSMRIGANKSIYGALHKDDKWVNQYLDRYDSPPFIPEDATNLIIEILNSYPDVVIIVVGPQTNIANVERVSPGTLQKAKKIVAMGGEYPSGNTYNIRNDIESAQLAQPFIDVYYGYELGHIITGEDSIFQADNPVRFGYWIYTGGAGRESWDLVTAAGAQNGDIWFTYVSGTNVIYGDGSNSFTPSSEGVNSYAVYKPGKDLDLRNYLNYIIGKGYALDAHQNTSQAATNYLLLYRQ